MGNLQAMVRVLVVFLTLVTYSFHAGSQSLPEVPFDIDFADVSIHLTESGRAQIQQEINRLYANRPIIQRDIDAIRQLSPLLLPILREANLPTDFRYAALPFADDEVNTFWFIRPAQVNDLNLTVSATIDERYHPVIATEAVARSLNKLQQTYGNYVQTLLHYIRGSTGLPLSQPTKASSTYTLLDPASPPLIWKIIARKLVIEREEPVHRPVIPYILYAFRNGGGRTIPEIAQHLRLTDEQMKPFNEWLRTSIIPTDRAYPVLIRLTADEFPVVKQADDSGWKTALGYQADVGFPMLAKQVNKETGLRSSAIFYTINERRGVQAQAYDNVITLAFYGHLKVRSLLEYNELIEKDIIWPGVIYYLERKAKRAKVPFHVVQKSQTLRDVSNAYGVRMKSLLKFNHLEPTQRVQTGRILWLQKKRPRNRLAEYQQLPPEEVKPVETPVLVRNEARLVPSDSLRRQFQEATKLPDGKNPLQAIALIDTVAGIDSVKTGAPTTANLSEQMIDEPQENYKLHVVKPGQTYYAVAQLYGVTVRQLYSWNNLSEKIPLKVGQELILDMTKEPVRLPVRPKLVRKPIVNSKPVRQNPGVRPFVVNASSNMFYHVVKAGQTVYRVALINKVSIDNVMRWNALKNYTLEVGQRLLIRK